MEFRGNSGLPSKRFFDGSDRSSVWNKFGEDQLGLGVGTVREASAFGVTVDTSRYLSENKNVVVRKDLMSSKSVVSQGSIGAKFKIVCLKDLMTSSNNDIYLGLIGYGPTIYIGRNCQKNHLGGKPGHQRSRSMTYVLSRAMRCLYFLNQLYCKIR
jgi:hypothetical protein